MASSTDQQQDERRGEAVFILTIVGAYASAFLVAGLPLATPRSALIIGLGIVFTVLGIRGYELACEFGALPGALAYFVVQTLLAAVIIYLSQAAGLMTLIVLPLTSQAAGSSLPRRWVLVVCGLALAALAVPVGLLADWLAALGAAASLLVGVVFTVSFTDIAVSEARARQEVERLATELRDANQQLRRYAAQAEELATMKERNRLAREIHDTLGHHLTAVNVQLEAARAVLGNDPDRALRAVENAQALTKNGLAEVRSSVAALRASPWETKPLEEAVRALTEELRAAGLVVDFTVTGEPREISPETKLALYRAAQEGLTNVRRHARASRVQVGLDYGHPARVHLAVEDNGVGATEAGSGFGLLGLRERIRLLGGEMETDTAPREGFRLSVKVPG